ncbi:MAG: hypothetical protein AAFP84_11755 [Actinomycetota bacterium]
MIGVGMIGLGRDVLAPTPGGFLLTFAVVLVIGGHVGLSVFERYITPKRPEQVGSSGALRRESPAVVNILVNDGELSAAGLRATIVDLASRGWLRILPPESDDEVSRVRPAASAFDGDSLLPHERLALQHVLARFTTDHAIPARHLAVDIRGSWWRRFRRLAEDEARRSGLVRRRWTPLTLAGPVAVTLVAFLAWNASRDDGTPVAVVDSIERRIISLAVLAGAILLAVRVVRHAIEGGVSRTEDGDIAAGRWVAVRERLVAGGFTTMAASATELGDRRLAYATSMGVARGANTELPMAREDHYRAWSSIAGRARLVRIRYPWRPFYGTNPVIALIGGLVTLFVGIRLRGFFGDVARQEAWDSIFERFEEQDWLIRHIATGLTIVVVVAIAFGLWAAFAGAADMFNTIERTGVVLRARRPAEVSPLPRSLIRRIERDRYSLLVAIDDGTSDEVTAWRANERTAMPQGVDAIVRATPILGYVRRATPVGHRLPD